MICKDCGYDNPSGVYRCQRCGNSLVPAIPRDTYINPYPQKKKHHHKAVWIFAFSAAFLLVLAGIIMFFVNGVFSENGAVSEASSAEMIQEDLDAGSSVSEDAIENYIEPDFIPEEHIKNDILSLPESNITIGMPKYESWTSNSLAGDSDYSCTFELGQGFTMDFYSYTADYPFSKSEEEEYFREDQNYQRLEGSNDQYFYTVNGENRVTATIVDRKNGRNYVIDIAGPEDSENPSQKKENLKRASYILDHQILDKSSMVLDPEAD